MPSIAEGWLYTGDLARRRDDGNYRIVGRCKEQIIRGGEKIYPAEVEEFLHHHPDVAEVAVVGLPDAKYGEIVAAWIVPRAGAALSPEAIQSLLQGPDHSLQDPPAHRHRGSPSQHRHGQGAQARPQRPGHRRARPGRRGGDPDGVSGRVRDPSVPWPLESKDVVHYDAGGGSACDLRSRFSRSSGCLERRIVERAGYCYRSLGAGDGALASRPRLEPAVVS